MSFINWVFYAFAALLIFSACMVITSRHPVRGVLFLVLGFFASSVLWMLLQAEFLALVLIFVYVGAVMTLFLFVVMMLNLDVSSKHKGWVRYLPFGVLIAGLLMIVMVGVMRPEYFNAKTYHWVNHPESYSNVTALGNVLYTQYVYPFELAAVLLLVAIIAAVSLAFRGPRGSKVQNLAQQHAVRPKDRVQLMQISAGPLIPTEKK